jgi:hypothetical protein
MIPPHPSPNNHSRRDVLCELLNALLGRRAWSVAELLRAGFGPAEVGRAVVDLRAAGITVESIHEPRQPLLTTRLQVVAINSAAATLGLDCPRPGGG